MEQTNQLTLICTGFHRSATSATANYIFDAGLNMGSNLIGGNISNSKGHFEDSNVVKLHDEQLANNGTNWQFHDECLLRPTSGFLASYIHLRNKKNTFWGVKDPRASLFLNEWKQELGDSGCFLFVARHWSSCIESLLHRHSRELTYGLVPLTNKSSDIQFWLKPELIANMWLSYNRRLVDFAKKNPNKTIVTTQRALFEGAPIIEMINDKFKFNLNNSIQSPFDSDLFRDKANNRIFESLSISLKSKLNKLWNELLEVTTFKSTDEEPVIEKSMPEPMVNEINEILQNKNTLLTSSNPIDSYQSWFAGLIKVTNVTEVLGYIDNTDGNNFSILCNNDWLEFIESNFPLNGVVHLSVAKLLYRLEFYKPAIEYFQSAITLGAYLPFVDMLLALCWQSLNFFDKAEFFFNKAIKSNPNNPLFYTSYGQFLLLLGNLEKAEKQLLLGYKKGNMQAACILPYCDFLEMQGRTVESLKIARVFFSKTNSPLSRQLLNRLLLKTDTRQGVRYYHESMREKLKGKDFKQWLVTSLQLIDNSNAERDFILRTIKHWNLLDV